MALVAQLYREGTDGKRELVGELSNHRAVTEVAKALHAQRMGAKAAKPAPPRGPTVTMQLPDGRVVDANSIEAKQLQKEEAIRCLNESGSTPTLPAAKGPWSKHTPPIVYGELADGRRVPVDSDEYIAFKRERRFKGLPT